MQYFDEKTKTELNINCDIDRWFEINERVQKVAGNNENKVLRTEALLRAASKEYKKGDLSLDELSCIIGHLFDRFTIDEKTKAESSDLMHVLEIGTDLSYYERSSVNHPGKNDFIKHLKLVLEY